MAKQRTLNEIRQEKNYGYRAPFGITNNIDQETTKQIAKIDLDEVKDEIVDKLTKDLHDIFFEHICDEMNKYHIFDIENYIISKSKTSLNRLKLAFDNRIKINSIIINLINSI